MAHFDTEKLDRIGRRRQWIAGIIAVVLFAIGIFAIIREEQLRSQLARERDQAAVTADQLCDQVKRLGRRCEVDPPPMKGEAGRGIRTARTVDKCYVLITYSDDTSNRVGPFCQTGPTGPAGSAGPKGSPGLPGSPGPAGSDGISITAVARDGCDLIISFSDGTSARTGPWCVPGPEGPAGPQGEPGRSITDAECVKNDDNRWRWRIEYSDGTVDNDAGPCFEPKPRVDPPEPAVTPS